MRNSHILSISDLTAVGEGAPSIEEKVRLAQSIRSHSEESSRQLDKFLIEDNDRTRTGLLEARKDQEELKGVLDKLSATPWHSAVFLRPVATSRGPRAIVAYGSSRRVVAFAEGVDAESLRTGDEVFLGHQLNVIMEKSQYGMPQYGETALFERHADERMVLKWRDEEVVVDVAGALRDVELEPGDQVRWDRTVWVAFEKIEPAQGRRFFLEEVPDIGRSQIGGQDQSLDTLLSALTTILVAPKKAAEYRLGGRQSVLLVGPPGCGKTLMARAAAAEVTHISGRRCRFGVVKPGEWENPYVGVSQANIRDCFRAAARDAPGVLFLDEIEAVGRIRGSMVGHHSDKFLAALLTELDGFTDRTGVAVIAASNRKDLVDPALLERLSDIEIHVGRPDMRGARAIFDIHLAPTLPYSSNGSEAEATRQEMIETAVSRFYSPNGQSELCVLRFRDGKTRTVLARELASGRAFEQVCRAARRTAFLRDVGGGDRGLRLGDIEGAVSDAMDRLRSTLTPRNAHVYLQDLPQDVDVVSVEPIVRKVEKPHRYLNLDVA